MFIFKIVGIRFLSWFIGVRDMFLKFVIVNFCDLFKSCVGRNCICLVFSFCCSMIDMLVCWRLFFNSRISFKIFYSFKFMLSYLFIYILVSVLFIGYI